MFLVSRPWARLLFDSSASHSFIATSCVREFGIEVETLEEPMHVSSPLRTLMSVDLICRGCVCLLLYRLKPLNLTPLQESYNFLEAMSNWTEVSLK